MPQTVKQDHGESFAPAAAENERLRAAVRRLAGLLARGRRLYTLGILSSSRGDMRRATMRYDEAVRLLNEINDAVNEFGGDVAEMNAGGGEFPTGPA